MSNQQILQPGQVAFEFEHQLHPGFEPAQQVQINIPSPSGMKVLAIGGLTVREEVASRILSGMVQRLPDLFIPYGDPADERRDEGLLVEKSLRLTDALFAQTRQQPPKTD